MTRVAESALDPGIAARLKRTPDGLVCAVVQAAALGVGEVLLNSMDADGTRAGFDTELIRAVRREVGVPLIASGGAGAVEHFPPAVEAGAGAVLGASVFHFRPLRVGEGKAGLSAAGIPGGPEADSPAG